MRWSATADLVAGTGVAAVGAACVALVRDVRDLPLAALPLLLGAHQIVEAAVWSSGGGGGAATVAWAVVALPLLAVWVPAGVWCAAPPSARNRLAVLLALGVVTAVPLTRGLVDGPVTAEIRGHTIGYTVALSHPVLLVAGYLLATVGSLLLSGDRWLTALGIVAAVGAVACWTLWRLQFVSTWCAFAALCSVLLLAWVRSRPRPSSPPSRRPASGRRERARGD
ncbi:hypothetical protein QBA57_35965 [Streptomyces scabiei]|uniref:DUF6629 family protein n=1 Tax=Streptomyces scabiei TaxID=1930 RepID=UPI001B3079EC|nr:MULTISPECIES: DUF6629 family protein [Streptomyces]MBP5865224.1 hypothetical protein [Streptomyces sp. LBUM 1484]MBP5881816.1 hypothetical protein [Streptomyces sp. LBUM 1487]MDW8471255.1 DUF6629 family protein [Streptomyces scabiei]MDX2572246.1 hypothetical protein [Streptomyces scabiei]MDX3151566.1 hypothetical protein [Streptomyces scabiei]